MNLFFVLVIVLTFGYGVLIFFTFFSPKMEPRGTFSRPLAVASGVVGVGVAGSYLLAVFA
ncbi:MAG TPA: hypothetical protein VNT53_05130 [Pseudolysinimonas sp.]|nr:hypothetical protein [Pseudolysinimonas sp.]